MPKESRSQKKTVGRVMHEFKHGELETRGRKVKNPRQAIAIALSEAGASRSESPSRNKRNLARTKRKERRGETARDMKEGRGRRTARKATRSSSATRGRSGAARRASSARSNRSGPTRAELYAEARRRNVPGRSRMNKAQLERALRRRR